MANRLRFSSPPTEVDLTALSSRAISADQLPSFAAGLIGLLPDRGATQANISAEPMPAAPFVWREDGRPDWGSMWTSFCDLAMYGGPPHRPEHDAVRTLPDCPPASPGFDATLEVQRGILETTDLASEPADPGWLAVTCRSARMAEWLCAAIALENVQARSDGYRLLVPASRGFTLESEVKSIITVVAKTVHYWDNHLEDS